MAWIIVKPDLIKLLRDLLKLSTSLLKSSSVTLSGSFSYQLCRFANHIPYLSEKIAQLTRLDHEIFPHS